MCQVTKVTQNRELFALQMNESKYISTQLIVFIKFIVNEKKLINFFVKSNSKQQLVKTF